MGEEEGIRPRHLQCRINLSSDEVISMFFVAAVDSSTRGQHTHVACRKVLSVKQISVERNYFVYSC